MKVGVIGVGRQGMRHARIYASLAGYGIELAGVFDVDHNASFGAAKKFATQKHLDPGKLLREVDAVSICTPAKTHKDLALRAFALGTSALIEKPVALTVGEAAEILAACPRGVVGMVGMTERYNPAVITLMGDLGTREVVALEFTRLSPPTTSNYDVDVVLDLMIHDLDIVVDLMGLPDTVAVDGWTDTDGLAYVAATLHYSTGANVILQASRITHRKVRTIQATTLDGYWEADLVTSQVLRYNWGGGQFDGQYTAAERVERRPVEAYEPLRREIEYFIGSARSGLSVVTDLSSAYEVMHLAEFIKREAGKKNRHYSVSLED